MGKRYPVTPEELRAIERMHDELRHQASRTSAYVGEKIFDGMVQIEGTIDLVALARAVLS